MRRARFKRGGLVKNVLDDRGVTSIEYGLVASLVAVAAISGIQRGGSSVSQSLDAIATAIESSFAPEPDQPTRAGSNPVTGGGQGPTGPTAPNGPLPAPLTSGP